MNGPAMNRRAQGAMVRFCTVAVLLIAAMAWPAGVFAGELVKVRVETDPPGAEISAGGMVVGVAPVDVALPVPEGGRLALRATLPGHEDAVAEVAAGGGKPLRIPSNRHGKRSLSSPPGTRRLPKQSRRCSRCWFH